MLCHNNSQWLLYLQLVSMFFALAGSVLPALADESGPSVSILTIDRDERELHDMHGWSLHVSRLLLATQPQKTARAIELLERQLEEIIRVVPKPAVEKLRKVPLFFMPEYPGIPPRAEYHPAAGWLRSNGRDTAMAKGIEFTNIGIFEAELDRMPNFALHELAHAWHHRELPEGFENSEVQAAFVRARESGRYDKVSRRVGNGRPHALEKAYAITNAMEYFAESTEAYFSRNDYFPFTRDELREHDPEMFDLLGELWMVNTGDSNKGN